MFFLLTCATDSRSQAEAHLSFYQFIDLLENFGVTTKRAFGDFDLYVPRDSYGLPEPKKYGSKNTYLLQVHPDRFGQFFDDLGKYTKWFASEDDQSSVELNLIEKQQFLQKYKIPLGRSEERSEIETLDVLLGKSGILSLREFTLAIKQIIASKPSNFSSFRSAVVSIDYDVRDFATFLKDTSHSDFHLSVFADYETCELAFIFCISHSIAVNVITDDGEANSPPLLFMLGHFVSPYHPSFRMICDVLQYLIVTDAGGSKSDEELTNIYFERANEFLPNLDRTEFLRDIFTAFAHCLHEYLNKDIPKFTTPENIEKSAFLVPLDYFHKPHYTDEDHQKMTDISREMSGEIYDALGPGLSGFESGDD